MNAELYTVTSKVPNSEVCKIVYLPELLCSRS